MENISIKLRVANKGLTQVVDYVQGTNTIPIVFDIVDYNIPAGATANIYIKKPSGAQIYNSCSISGNEITVNPTTQMFAESGKQFGQLQILSGQKILESFLILFDVEKSIVDDSAIESSDEFTALEDALNSIDDATTEAENAVSAAKQAVSDAQTAVKNANTAISGANTAASSANSAAESATNAASAANTAAEGANTAAQNANEKASAANSAAEAANNAVDALEEALQGTVINDNSVSNFTTYSSQKIEGEFDDVNEVIYEIGGRNLAYLTGTMPIGTGDGHSARFFKSYSTFGKLSKTENGLKFSFGSNVSSALQFPLSEFGNIKNNEDLTISFTYRGNITNFGNFYVLQKTPPNVPYFGFPDLVGDEEWHLYSHTFNSADANKGVCAGCLMFYSNASYDSTKWIEIKKESLKLEIGSTPTRWTPAPEDIQNEIDGKLSSTGDGSSLTIDFTEAASVSNITSGSTLAVLFGQILKNQNDFLDADTIQAAEDAGILSSGGGLTLLNDILQLCLQYAPVEVGTEGIWTYVKYADGRAECYGQQSINWGTGVAWMGGYHHTQIGTTAFPSGLFAAPPVLNSFTIGSVIGAVVGQSTLTKDEVAIIMLNGDARGSAKAYPVGFIAKGKWK